MYVVDDDTTLHAMDAATGDARWRVAHGTDAPLATPVVAGGRIYLEVDGENGEVHAVRTADGSTAWRRRVGYPLRGPVAVAEGTVYAAGRHRDYGGKLTALDAADGEIGWTATPDAYELGPPAVADGVVYVGSRAAEYGGTLYAVDGATGDERWRIETRGVEFGDYVRSGVTGSPAVVDEYVYVATAPGDVYAIAGRG